MQEIQILTLGRTGSTALGELFKNVPSIQYLYEIFNKSMFSDEYSNNLMSTYLGECNIEFLEQYFTKNPNELIDLYRQESLDKIIVYKILYYQLKNKEILQILNRPDSITVFLDRNYIDTYISMSKAKITKTYSSSDTTDLKIEINYSDLIKSYTKHRDRIQSIFLYKSITNKIVLDYNNFIRNITIDKFNKFLSLIGISDTVLDIDIDLPVQDKNLFWGDKITNYEEIMDKLISDKMDHKILNPILLEYTTFFDNDTE